MLKKHFFSEMCLHPLQNDYQGKGIFIEKNLLPCIVLKACLKNKLGTSGCYCSITEG